jgi:hypothetical protein
MSEQAAWWNPVNPPRDLSTNEERLFVLLLSQPFPGRDELRQQVQLARVSEEERGGYLSVVLTVDRSAAPPAPVQESPSVEAEGLDEGVEIEVLLHTRGGYLFMLEIIRMDGKPLTRFPDPMSLELFVHGE